MDRRARHDSPRNDRRRAQTIVPGSAFTSDTTTPETVTFPVLTTVNVVPDQLTRRPVTTPSTTTLNTSNLAERTPGNDHLIRRVRDRRTNRRNPSPTATFTT